ncbi:MAG: type I methionyl aminopeptidase [Candidatus Wildermuthbacteria bacterium]|nr:type I methionyl aminopeptidase [Candidatus Wildermuthbacteria bacterium]
MITRKTEKELAHMREGGKILASLMAELSLRTVAGVETQELETLARGLIKKSFARSAFMGYEGFPAALCVSINEEVVHGTPSRRRIMEGDLVSLDMGIVWKGMNLDMARTVPVGTVSRKAQELCEAVNEALEAGIAELYEGNTLGDVGNTIESVARRHGFFAIEELCGHGIGEKLHEEPQVPNMGVRGRGARLEAGMVLCVEPMFSLKDAHVVKAEKGFAFITQSGSLAAHAEDTVAVGAKGPEIFTR